jgi:hypothetical protein
VGEDLFRKTLVHRTSQSVPQLRVLRLQCNGTGRAGGWRKTGIKWLMGDEMGNVIYLPKSYLAAASDTKMKNDAVNNDAVQKFLFGVSSMLIIYGLYRLVRTSEGK